MITVFLKSITLPWPSVSRPSSSTCNKTFHTSSCAFSTSSNSTTACPSLATGPVRCPSSP